MGQNYVLLLSDAKGVTVDFFGDPAFEAELKESGLYLGSEWSEHVMGTCGVGVCLETRQPVTIHQNEHFNIAHTHLSCTAAPIFDVRGSLIAVLDLSLLESPRAKKAQNLALELVKSSVRKIETANLMADCGEHWIIHLSELPDRLDVDPSASIAVNAAGEIVGVNRCCYAYSGKEVAHAKRIRFNGADRTTRDGIFWLLNRWPTKFDEGS